MSAKRVHEIVQTYQDPQVRTIEDYFKKVEQIEALRHSGVLTRQEYLSRWIALEKIYGMTEVHV